MIKKYVEFLNEEVNNKIIYFFHPKLTYDTRVESQSIELINLYFDNPVIYNTPDLKGGYYKYADDKENFNVEESLDAKENIFKNHLLLIFI